MTGRFERLAGKVILKKDLDKAKMFGKQVLMDFKTSGKVVGGSPLKTKLTKSLKQKKGKKKFGVY